MDTTARDGRVSPRAIFCSGDCPFGPVRISDLCFLGPAEALVPGGSLAMVRVAERPQVRPHQPEVWALADVFDVVDVYRRFSAARNAANRIFRDKSAPQSAPDPIEAAGRGAFPLE